MSTDSAEVILSQEGESPSAADLRGSATRGGVLLLSSRLVGQLFTWLVTIQIARLLRPFDYGVLALGMTIVLLTDILAESGVGKALVQKERLSRDEVDQIFTLSLLMSVSLYLVLFVMAVPAASYFEIPDLVKFLRVTGALILVIPFRVIPMALLDRRIQIGRQSVIVAITGMIQSFLVLVLAFSGLGYWAMAIGALFGRFLEAVSLFALAPWVPRLRRPSSSTRALFHFGIQVSASAILWLFYNSSDAMVIGKFEGAVKLGYYALAFQLISLPLLKITSMYNSISYPVFCRLKDQPELIGRWHVRSITLMIAVGAPALIGLALVSKDAIQLILGEKWLPASIPLQFLSVAGIVMMVHGTFPILFQALGRPEVDLKCTLSLALIMPLGFLLAVTQVGMIGVCMVWVTVYPALFGAILATTRSITGLGPGDLCRPLLPVVISLTLMMSTVVMVRWLLEDDHSTALRLAASIVVGVFTYFGSLWSLMKQNLLNDYQTIRDSLRAK